MRVAVLAHDWWEPGKAKTGEALVRYSRNGWSREHAGLAGQEVPVPTEVVAVIDRSRAGTDAGAATPDAEGIPVVASAADALAFEPDALAIGIAPVGGALPDAWRADLRTAISNGLTVISGLHAFLKDDAELAALAREHDARLVDVRALKRDAKRIATGEAALVDAFVVTIVGTECGSGKMTTAVELVREARRRGIDAGFVATGQTGLMVGCDAGLPVDAVVSDFAAGLTEEAVLKAASRGRDLIVVEGQGALSHPAYSGVSLSLLHGSWPDALVICDEPTRESVSHFEDAPVAFPVNRLGGEIHLNEALAEPLSGARVAAASLMTPGLTDEEAARVIRGATMETGLRGGDVFRGGAGVILDAVLAHGEGLGVWKGNAFPKGAKAARRGRAVRGGARHRAA